MSRKGRAKAKQNKTAKVTPNQKKRTKYAAKNREETGGRASVDMRTDAQREAAYVRPEERQGNIIGFIFENVVPKKEDERSEKTLQPERYISRQIVTWSYGNEYKTIADFSKTIVLRKQKRLTNFDGAVPHETDVYVWGFEKDDAEKHPNKVYGIRDSKRIMQYTAQDNFGSFVFGEGNCSTAELQEKLYAEALKRAEGLAKRFGKKLVDLTDKTEEERDAWEKENGLKGFG